MLLLMTVFLVVMIMEILIAIMMIAAMVREDKNRRKEMGREEENASCRKVKDSPVNLEDTLLQAEWDASVKPDFAPLPRANHKYEAKQRKLFR